MPEELYAMKLVHVNTGDPTPFDGQYLKEYDPSRFGQDPEGKPIIVHIVTTPDIQQALHMDLLRLLDEWKKVDPRQPIRPDRKPNRPLTAFTIEAVLIPAKEKV